MRNIQKYEWKFTFMSYFFYKVYKIILSNKLVKKRFLTNQYLNSKQSSVAYPSMVSFDIYILPVLVKSFFIPDFFVYLYVGIVNKKLVPLLGLRSLQFGWFKALLMPSKNRLINASKAFLFFFPVYASLCLYICVCLISNIFYVCLCVLSVCFLPYLSNISYIMWIKVNR